MRIVKIIGIGLAALVGLFVIAAVVFALTFDPNDYRDQIAGLVRQETGREFAIEGDLSLSFFPWLGFEVGPATLSDAQGFGDGPFASIEGAGARVKLMPLLSRQIEIGRLSLRGLDLKLIVNADGTGNWDDLAALGGDDAPAAGEEGGTFAAKSLGSLEILDARVRYADRAAGATYTISGIDVKTGTLVPGQPFTVDTRMTVVLSDPELKIELEGGGTVTTDIEAGTYSLGNPDLKLVLTGAGIPLEKLNVEITGEQLAMEGGNLAASGPKIKFRGPGSGDPYERIQGRLVAQSVFLQDGDQFGISRPLLKLTAAGAGVPGGEAEVDLKFGEIKGSLAAQTVELTNIWLDTYGLSATGRATGEQILDAPAIRGKLKFAEFSPRALLTKMGSAPPETADGKALTSAAGEANVAIGPNAVEISNLAFKLDDSSVSGNLAVTDLAAGSLRFSLTVDEIDVDRYLGPAGATGGSGPEGEEPEVIPAEVLRPLDIDGQIEIGAMRFSGIDSTAVRIGIKAKDGKLRVKPATASLYGGTYRGDIQIDVTGPRPSLSLNERLQGIQFGEFAKAVFDSEKLSGKMTGKVELTGTGARMSEIQKSLNGNAQFRFQDGALEGTNLWYEISRAVALVKQQAAPATPDENRTRFSEMKGTATVADGIMTNDDFSALLPFLKVSGQGQVNLIDQGIDYNLAVKVVKSPELTGDAKKLSGETIPVKITGTLAEPKVRPDVGGYLEEKAKEKVDELKEDLEEKAKDALKSLIGGG